MLREFMLLSNTVDYLLCKKQSWVLMENQENFTEEDKPKI